MKLVIVVMLIISQNVFALGAHVHGLAGLDIATDKKQILVMFKSPGFSVVGFEHKPKTKEQKEKLSLIKKQWLKNQNLFLFKNLKCNIKSKDFKVLYTGKSHSEINAEMTLECDKEVKGHDVKLMLMQTWRSIKEIHLQVLREDGSVVSKKIHEKNYSIQL